MNALLSQPGKEDPAQVPTGIFPANLRGLICEVLERYGTNWQMILDRRQTQRVSDARHLILSFLAWHFNESLVGIGSLMGGRDHGTVMHSRNKMASLYRESPRVRDLIDDLEFRYLKIEDHSAVIRDRSKEPTSSGFRLPESALPIATRPDRSKPKTADGKRRMTEAEIDASGDTAVAG